MLLPGEVNRAADQLLTEIDAITNVDLHIKASSALASLPFEATLTGDGRTPVLQPRVRMRRSVLGHQSASKAAMVEVLASCSHTMPVR